jgi:hypothetical protein
VSLRSERVRVLLLTVIAAWVALAGMSLVFLLESFVAVPLLILAATGGVWLLLSSGPAHRRAAAVVLGVVAVGGWGVPFLLFILLSHAGHLGGASAPLVAGATVASASVVSALTTWHCSRAALRAVQAGTGIGASLQPAVSRVMAPNGEH